MAEEEKTPEQIPWAERTKVAWQSDNFISLEQKSRSGRDPESKTEADIYARGLEWSVTLDTKAEIHGYMDLNKQLTNDLDMFWESDKEEHYISSFRDRIMRWLEGGAARGIVREGPKEWRPGRKKREPIGKLDEDGGYGYGNTYNEDSTYYWGDTFEFAHVEFEDGGEGAVILWNTSGGPMGGYSNAEVWLGSFDEFMTLQFEHEPYSYETFLRWNENFENGFMWAFEKLGVFENWDEHVEDLRDDRVRGVLKAIEKDPSILLPESVEKILLKFDEFPRQIQNAVRWLMTNKRRDLEKALGQKLIWGDLYAE